MCFFIFVKDFDELSLIPTCKYGIMNVTGSRLPCSLFEQAGLRLVFCSFFKNTVLILPLRWHAQLTNTMGR